MMALQALTSLVSGKPLMRAFSAAALVIMPCVASAATYTMRAQVSGMVPKAQAVPEVQYVGKWSAYRAFTASVATNEVSSKSQAQDYSSDGVAYFSTSTNTDRPAIFAGSEVPSAGCVEIGQVQHFGVYMQASSTWWYAIFYEAVCTGEH